MKRVLVPVDGSPNSLKALRHVVDGARKDDSLEIHVVHVRAPFSRYIARFLSKRSRAAYHRDEAGKALKPARELLETALIPHATHVELGDAAQAIDRVARRLHVDRIVMGTARKNSFTRMIEDSVTNRVVELAQVPVEVIAGQSVSRLERIGIPAGIGMALVLLFAAID